MKEAFRILIHLTLLRPLVRLFFGVNAVGVEHLASIDQFILIANHNSHLDVPLLFTILPARHLGKVHPVAAREYFSRWKVVFRAVNFIFQPIWIVRGEIVESPMKSMEKQLSTGHSVIVFPEGTRGTPGEMARFKTGVGMLAAAHPDIPIVPVFLLGPERVFPKATRVPIPLWNEVTVGPPQVLTGGRRDITEALEQSLHELSESAVVNRHRRRGSAKPPFTVAVLGIDGSGKSTLARAIAQDLAATSSACLVTDSLEFYQHGGRKEMQPLPGENLREAFGKHAKEARSLKHYKLPKLIELLLRDHIMGEVARWYSPEYIVLDGCPLMNLAAWATLYKGDLFDAETCCTALRVLTGRCDTIARNDPIFTKFPELTALRRLRLTSMKLPDAVIMLDVDPSVSIARIEGRGEHRQVHETEEKLSKLREGYRLVCEVVRTEFDIPTKTLVGDDSVRALVDTSIGFVGESMATET